MLRNLVVFFLALVLSSTASATPPLHPYAATDRFTPNIIAITLAVLGFVVGGVVGKNVND